MTLQCSPFVPRSPCEVDLPKSLCAEPITSEDLTNPGNHDKYKVYRSNIRTKITQTTHCTVISVDHTLS
jgi:hypothetical protein